MVINIEATVGSLFSGIGGIEIGFEKQGFETLWFIENNPYAQQILKKRFPKTPIYGNIEEVDFKAIPKVDILTGGFPCQDISNAGKRAGIEGSRSSLWKYFKKAIGEIRPRIAFIENVSAILGRGLSTVLCDLASVGYDAEWHCVPASAIGALHRRDRIFIISYPNEYGSGFDNGTNKKETRKVWGEEESIISIKHSEDVLDTNVKRFKRNKQSEFDERKSKKEIESRGRDVSDSFSSFNTKQQNERGEILEGTWWTEPCGEGWWSAEPKLGRVAHGVPNRVHRIKCLGNAVVPQVAEVFAEAIKEKMKPSCNNC